MVRSHGLPLNLLIQEATLIHALNLTDFFRFAPNDVVGPPASISAYQPDMKALHYCCVSPKWCPTHFRKESALVKALHKGVAHLSSRVLTNSTVGMVEPWDGHKHIHGTVELLKNT